MKSLWFVTEQYDAPITNMFDVDGEATGAPDEAHAIVAGPLADGQWLASECWAGDIVEREARVS